jgi:hypothetical protein
MRQVIIIAGLTLLLGAGPLAADVPADVQVKLQGAMLRHIEEIAVDGAYTYLDTRDQTVKTVYPASVHPMVVPFGEDYFVCSEVIKHHRPTSSAACVSISSTALAADSSASGLGDPDSKRAHSSVPEAL